MSDVSEASHVTGMSNLSGAGSTSQLIAHSSRVRTPQRHNSESILYMTTDEQQLQQQNPQLIGHHQGSSPTGTGASPVASNGGSPIGVADDDLLRYQHRSQSSSALGPASSPGSSSNSVNNGSSSPGIRSSRSNNRLFPISTYTEIPNSNGNNNNNNLSSSNSSNNNISSLSNTTGNGILQGTTTPTGTSMVDGSKQLSPHNWQSVAERINELEKHQQQSGTNLGTNSIQQAPLGGNKNLSQQQQQYPQQQQKYTYFDPSKTHRVSNPSLKAFQKKAVISYFERQQAYARESSHNLSRPTSLNLGGGGSPPSLKSVSQRSSISSAYSSSGSTLDLAPPSSHSSIVGGGPYHHHPSIAVQQQLDKIAANNLRNQLASVHTMNLLNKVQSPSHHLIDSQMMILNNSSSDVEDPHLNMSVVANGDSPPPPPPPRSRSIVVPVMNGGATVMSTTGLHAVPHMTAVRRTSSASEYSSVRDKMIQQRQQLSKDLLGPMIMGPIIALDDWVPERPPKNPMLRIPSPELPPPPPTLSPTEDIILNQDEPLPPPPPEILRHIRQLSDSGEPKSNTASRRNSFAGQTNKQSLYRASTLENLSPPPLPNLPHQTQISHLIIPPAVPKKPQPPMEPHVIYRRSSSSMAKSQPFSTHQNIMSNSNTAIHQAQRVLVNGKPDTQRHSLPMALNSPPTNQLVQQPQFIPRQSDQSRVSMRKRSHNSSEFLVKPPGNNGSGPVAMTPPPPLKPRMPMQQLPIEVQQLQQQQQQLISSMGSKSCTGRNRHGYRVNEYSFDNDDEEDTDSDEDDNKDAYRRHCYNVNEGESSSNEEDRFSVGSFLGVCRGQSSSSLAGSRSNISHTDSVASSSGGSSATGGSSGRSSRGWLVYFGNKLHLAPMRKTFLTTSNSKASYLPRQPRDKLHSDPDHGSYKLTLTSNEDSINHNDVFPEEIITSSKCNLPDVLPPGVKYSLYSANNNNNNNGASANANGKSIVVGKPPKTIPHSAPIISTNSLKSMFNFTPQSQTQQNQVTPPSASSPVTPPPAYSPQKSPSLPGSPTSQVSIQSPKYTSQSTFDLKKTQILDSAYLSTQSCQAQIGIPIGQQQPLADPINSSNYLNHPPQSTITNTSTGSQQTVNNYNEISEKLDISEPSPICAFTEQPVASAETHHNHHTESVSTSSSPFIDDESPSVVSQEDHEAPIISSNNISLAEVNHATPSVAPADPNETTCSQELSTNTPTAAVVLTTTCNSVSLERATKEINLAEPLPPPEEENPPETHNQQTPPQQLQRTEIVLRVAAPTSEASSQTEDDLNNNTQADANLPRRSPTTTVNALSQSIASQLVFDQSTSESTCGSKHSIGTSTASPPGTPTGKSPFGGFFGAPRKVHPEEIDCDKLSHDLISQLSPSDKLHTILAPKTFKSSSDYVSDLFNIQIAPRPMKKDASTATPEASPQKSPMDILTTSSSYFQVSEPKAKLMTRYGREMTLINGDCCDLTKKKEELVQRLGKKLLVLSNEQTSIAEESNANDLLGNDVALKVAQKVRPSDASKFRSYVDDVGYITMLLLSLSGRLARTENALHNIDESHADKKILEAKRDRLLEQLDEAKQLKDDIDRRGAIIGKILEKSLTIEEYADYDYFINMKAKLIVDSREIADKIKLGEEQLAALKDTLVQSEC
ncbi:protein Shroom isoform X2 [Uranotaenia lowii]|uniref:protein Shroom isoform X2 n=1 Tax=Uranotaenia lowii TaxID=190385 RepID=UPI00247A86B9|nr:protein Shroom isoform X2 [Uranotaenia lowii]